MMRAAHRFFWGYGSSGFDILFRQGEGRSLETPCLDEVGRWKLAFDHVAQVVTPVFADGKAIALLAFRSRVAARAAGDKVRETACAAIPFEDPTVRAAHQHLLDLVPPFSVASSPSTQAVSEPLGHQGTSARGAMPAWAARAWARLLDDRAVLVMSETDASLTDALRVVALLPPAVARRVAVGEGLLPGTKPRCHGLYIAHTGDAASERVDAPGTDNPSPAGAPAVRLEGLVEAWFCREILPRTHDAERAALELWDHCAADAGCDIAQFDRAHLLSAMLSDAAHDWLRSGAVSAVTDSLAVWLDVGLASGIIPDPVRFACLIDAMPPQVRSEAILRLPQLASRLAVPDARIAAVMVGAALEDVLQRGLMRELDSVFFDSDTWIGAVLSGSQPKPELALFANVAWSLVSELLVLWAAQKPDVLARALARPSRGAADGRAGWLRRLARRPVRPRTIEDVLRKLAQRRTPDAAQVSERLLPTALRTADGRSSLRPHASVLEAIFATAVLTAAKAGRTESCAVAAVAPLLARRL